MRKELSCDVLVAGGGTGGCAAALSACRAGMRVVLTEPCEWIGGQLTSQAVPPDENRWIEMHGGTLSYQQFRTRVREYYRRNYPLSGDARSDEHLNPGGGFVSRLCHEPKVAHAVLQSMLAPFESQGLLHILRYYEPTSAATDGDSVSAVTFASSRGEEQVTVCASYFLDATELGDLLPLVDCEFVVGAESQEETGELHAKSDGAEPGNVQAITWCFALAYDPAPGANHIIEKPGAYDRWRDYVPPVNPPWPGKLFSWTDCAPWTLEPWTHYLFPSEREAAPEPRGGSRFAYRQIVAARHWDEHHRPHEATIVNWPMNDYIEADLMSADPAERTRAMTESREMALSLMYWLQTEAPNYTTGGGGYPGLYPAGGAVGTNDGLAQFPYIRESRRIRARFTVTEEHVGSEMRYGATRYPGVPTPPELIGKTGAEFADSVGIGQYRIDLHISTGGDNYIDCSSVPFRIPLGALIPIRLRNLVPACKNIGTTHITNGCYRLHPVEWNIGESAGALAAFCIRRDCEPGQVHETPELLADFQSELQSRGVRIDWQPPLPV